MLILGLPNEYAIIYGELCKSNFTVKGFRQVMNRTMLISRQMVKQQFMTKAPVYILITKKKISTDKMLLDNNNTSKTETIVNYFSQCFVNISHTLALKLNDVEPGSHKKYFQI